MIAFEDVTNLVVTEEERKVAEDEKHSSSNVMSAILYLLNKLNKEELVTQLIKITNTIDKKYKIVNVHEYS